VERAGFQRKQKRLAVERLVFVDEFGVNTAMTPAYARSPRGERAHVNEPFNHGSNISVISSLSLAGVGATMSVEGAVDTQVFDAFVEHVLIPTLLEGDIVVLDNVKFHYSTRAVGLIEAAGASVLHIPAYSPDFNPIEECISKIKGILRSVKARTRRKLLNVLAKAIEKVTVDDICGWFAHCGYTYSFI
jgi:transposase